DPATPHQRTAPGTTADLLFEPGDDGDRRRCRRWGCEDLGDERLASLVVRVAGLVHLTVVPRRAARPRVDLGADLAIVHRDQMVERRLETIPVHRSQLPQ